MKKILAVCAILFMSAGLACAAQDTVKKGQEEQELNVSGNIQMGVTDEGSINAAIGNKSTAEQEHFAVESGNIKGNVMIDGNVSGAVDAAIGNEAHAKQKVGVIGK